MEFNKKQQQYPLDSTRFDDITSIDGQQTPYEIGYSKLEINGSVESMNYIKKDRVYSQESPIKVKDEGDSNFNSN